MKAEHWRFDAFELWCWRRLLRVPWTARRSNQSILKDINPECSLEGLMLKLQYFGHLMWRADSLEKTLILGGIGGRRRRGRWRMRWLDGIIDSMPSVWVNSGSWWWTGRPGVLQFMGSQESDTTERLNWTELMHAYHSILTALFSNFTFWFLFPWHLFFSTPWACFFYTVSQNLLVVCESNLANVAQRWLKVKENAGRYCA